MAPLRARAALLSALLLAVCVLLARASFAPSTAVADIAATGASISCFADFNSDKHTDLATATVTPAAEAGAVTTSTVQVWLYSPALKQFQPDGPTIVLNGTVVSMFANDIDKDNALEILVFTSADAANADAANADADNGDVAVEGALTVTMLRVLELGQALQVQPVRGFTGDHQPLSVPAAFDYNNDFFPDLIGTAPGGERRLWSNTGAVSKSGEYIFTALSHDDTTQFMHRDEQDIPFVQPSATAFVDLNGDCLSDVFIFAGNADAPYAELWLNSNTEPLGSNYVMAREYSFPAGAGAPVWGDVDADGTLDMVFPVCLPAGGDCSEKSEIHVLYNIQKPMCASMINPGRNCRGQQNLCTADASFYFEFPDKEGTFTRNMS